MLNKTKQKAGRFSLLLLSIAVLSTTMLVTVGCSNKDAAPEMGNATPQPPPSNIDPVTGKPRGESAQPTSPRGPRG